MQCLGSKIIGTSPKSLAERTGAAQYAVHFEEELRPETVNDDKNVQKRLSDNQFDDSDYEIYQGVVGRPGIDFPILSGIPQTTFNCRKFGNGYFADLETECQVFHICEGGKKISFLCPNGTIFQQAELICDWWFRVNCAASPGHYAESSELLSRARHHYRLQQASKHLFEFTSKGTDNPIEKSHAVKKEQFEVENVSIENLDFEDISPIKESFKHENNISRNPKDLSKAIGNAETKDFVEFPSISNTNLNKYQYDKSEYFKSNTSKSDFTLTTTESFIKKSSNLYNYQSSPNQTFKATTPGRGSITYQNSKIKNHQQKKEGTSLDYKFTNELRVTTPSITYKKRPSTYTTARKIESHRSTPFYTPTIPSIMNKQTIANLIQITSTTEPKQSTANMEEASDHAYKMIMTLKNLNMNNYNKSTASNSNNLRTSRVVPSSSAPDSLHSLALYFATAVDNMITHPQETTTDFEKSLNIEPGNVTTLSKSLVSNKTVQKYEQLFGIEKGPTTSSTIENSLSEEETSDFNDLNTEYSNNPAFSASGSPQIRVLAQVFTHALSAYLHDPLTFRRVLSEIRPTEPSLSNDIPTNYIADSEYKPGPSPTSSSSFITAPLLPSTSNELEVLDFSDNMKSPAKNQINVYTTNTLASDISEWQTTTLRDLVFSTPASEEVNNSLLKGNHISGSKFLTSNFNHLATNRNSKNFNLRTDINNPVAMEINGGLLVSTSFPYFKDNNAETTTTTPTYNNTNYLSQSYLRNFNYTVTDDHPSSVELASDLSFELLPPNSQTEQLLQSNQNLSPSIVDDNDLQRAQSQSVLAKSNQVQSTQNFYKLSTTNLPIKPPTTERFTLTRPTINGHYITHTVEPTTISPYPIQLTTIPYTVKYSQNPWTTLPYTIFLDPLTINDDLMQSHHQKTVTPSPNTYLPKSTSSYEPTISSIESANDLRTGKELHQTDIKTEDEYMDVMQRKANSMFGKLNDTSAGHLLNVMKKASNNKMVRKLILLLIQTCNDDDDDDHDTSIEESRSTLLNALIGMDRKLDNYEELQVIRPNTYRQDKSIDDLIGTSTEIPITTYRRPFISDSPINNLDFVTNLITSTNRFDGFFHSTTLSSNEIHSSTVSPETSTYPNSNIPETTTLPTPVTKKLNERQTNRMESRRITKDLDDLIGQAYDTNKNNFNKNSDVRALELLRSLYSLAGKFGKR